MFKKFFTLFIFIFFFFIAQSAFAFTSGPSIKKSDTRFYPDPFYGENVLEGEIRKPPTTNNQKFIDVYFSLQGAGSSPKEYVGGFQWKQGHFAVELYPKKNLDQYRDIIFEWNEAGSQNKVTKSFSLSSITTDQGEPDYQRPVTADYIQNLHTDGVSLYGDLLKNKLLYENRYFLGGVVGSDPVIKMEFPEASRGKIFDNNFIQDNYLPFDELLYNLTQHPLTELHLGLVLFPDGIEHGETSIYLGVIDISSFVLSEASQDQNTSDQNTSNNTVTFTFNSYEFKNTQADNSGAWALRLDGDWTRSADEDIYLVLEDTQGASKTTLCHYQSGGGNSFHLKFPSCAGTTNNPNVVTLDGKEYGKIQSLIPGHSYKVYFSNVAGGAPISQEIGIGTVPQPPANVNGVVTDLVVTPKEQSGKRYYEISGKVTETKAGKILNFVVIKDGETTGEIIGETEYTKNNVFIIPTAGELQNIGSLAPGHYRLEIKEIGGGVVQTYQIPTEISAVNQQGGADPLVSNQTVQDIRAGKGLVKGDCGYKLGDGGRMCGLGDFIELIQRIIEYIFVLILPIAAIVFAYAGYLFMTSGGDPNKRNAAKNAMTKLVLGIVVIMMAWLIVKTILVSLGVSAGFRTFLKF